ncbi:MAG: hypothetical protein MO853_04450 [Candidatus Protistobacter heckmanni]|nr:hypothetical protein [Candidatus Protistobacter heckmanni]
MDPWVRSQRVSYKTLIGVPHLMASSAIPFIFPAVRLDLEGELECFGDGAMRQSAPISPAVHLGAKRMMVIGVGRKRSLPEGEAQYPSLAQIGGHAMASIFLDMLANDVERLQRINETLKLIPDPARTAHPCAAWKCSSSTPARNSTRWRSNTAARGNRARNARANGGPLLSYLLFDRAYTRALMRLGLRDGLAQADAILRFLAD